VRAEATTNGARLALELTRLAEIKPFIEGVSAALQRVRTRANGGIAETAIRLEVGMAGTSHKDLVAWQLGMDLVVSCYELTNALPRDERFGLVSQMRRAAISMPANLAEGHARRSRPAYANHVSIALGSQAELETLVELCRRLRVGAVPMLDQFERDLRVIGKVLYGLHRALAAG
jgi:four helix bundle protein